MKIEVEGTILAIGIIGIMIGGSFILKNINLQANLEDARLATKEWIADYQRASREKETMENMLSILCITHEKDPVCLWYVNEYQQRG